MKGVRLVYHLAQALAFVLLFFNDHVRALWTAETVVSSSALTITSTDVYVDTGLSTTITTTSAADKVLVLVNLNFKQSGTIYYCQFKIYRNGADQTGSSEDINVNRASETTEVTPATMIYLDAPGAVGTYTYSVMAMGNGILSHLSQTRQLAAIVFPNSIYPSNRASSFTSLPLTLTTYVSVGVDTTAVLSTATSKVLLTFTGTIDSDAPTTVKFTLYRNNAIIAANFVLQMITSGVTDKNRPVTFTYLDAPGTTGTFTYSVPRNCPPTVPSLCASTIAI